MGVLAESNFVKRRRMPSSENSQTTITTAAVHVETEDKISSQARKAALEHLTEIADQMLEAGITAIYEMSREVLENSSFLWEYMYVVEEDSSRCTSDACVPPPPHCHLPLALSSPLNALAGVTTASSTVLFRVLRLLHGKRRAFLQGPLQS